MHQDAYIFRRIGTGMPQTAEHLRSTILTCGAANNNKQLDPDVKALWGELLRTVYPTAFADDPPDMDKWHRRCYTILERLLPTSSRFVGFARHVCDGLGFSYPTPDEIEIGDIHRESYSTSLRGSRETDALRRYLQFRDRGCPASVA